MAMLTLEMAYDAREEGITFGGKLTDEGPSVQRRVELSMLGPQPEGIAGLGDATWSQLPKDITAVAVMFYGAVAAANVKSVHVVTSCSMEVEGIASLRASDLIEQACEALRAMGEVSETAPLLGTDAASNMSVINQQGVASHSRHMLRRWQILAQRVRRGDLRMTHVGDAEMAVDVMTKWKPIKKVDQAIAWLTNAGNYVPRRGAK